WIMAGLVVFMAVLGYLFSLMVVDTKQADNTLKIDWNCFKSTYQLVQQSSSHHTAFFAVIAISWFWFIGAVMLSQIPALVKYDLQADDGVVMLFLTLFSVGIAVGSGLIGRMMPGAVHIKWHWIMQLGIALMLLLTVWVISVQKADSVNWVNVSHETLFSVGQFVSQFPASMSLIFLAVLALLGGMYIVPLYTILQTHTPSLLRARMVAVNNIMNALLMVLSALLIMLGFSFGFTLLEMIFALAVFNLYVVWLLYRKRFKAGR
ncbi:MAG: hypothetical protein R3254_10870, partial [Thiomicrorhabdus sp.]|nr:hypothetical protein [Thiomicrorhabdus sp.]